MGGWKVNNQDFMISKNASGLIDRKTMLQQQMMEQASEEIFNQNNTMMTNNTGMMKRTVDTTSTNNMMMNIAPQKKDQEIPVPEKEFDAGVITEQPKTKENVTDVIRQKQAAVKNKMNQNGNQTQTTTITKQPVKPVQQSVQQPAQPVKSTQQPVQQSAQQSVVSQVIKINRSVSLDDLTKMYINMFKEHFNIELSSSICFENMRKFCEINTKDPDKTLYFLENTYRVSTLLYLTGNLPILIATSIFAEKNRKNILKYVTTEVENGAKSYEEVRDLRIKRWSNKCTTMTMNDAMTVTPGVTTLSPELITLMKKQFDDICIKSKRFNKELTSLIDGLDDAAKNDVVYIYSNWWYFLQGFENVHEMRSYIMAITDDTRKNLKI